MEQERRLSASVSGSFDKYKKEIDDTIDHLEDLGVKVMGPDKGWLLKAPTRIYEVNKIKRFRALPSEIGMTAKEIEDRFLDGVSKSDFLYVVNPDGYIGETTGFEVGWAFASGIPVFCQIPVTLSLLDFSIAYLNLVKPATIEEAIKAVRNQLNEE